MIPWETFKEEQEKNLSLMNSRPVDVACPNCGEQLYMRTDIILSSYPPQRQFECHNCDFIGSTHVYNAEEL